MNEIDDPIVLSILADAEIEQSWIAYIGDGRGNVKFDNTPDHYCLVCCLDDKPSPPIEIWNYATPITSGLKVIIGYTKHNPDLLRVIKAAE